MSGISMDWSRWLYVALLGCLASRAGAQEILVAAASNFSAPIREIVTEFEAGTGHDVVLVFGSTGRHYAQIINGAPYSVFLAADELRPRLLEENGNAIFGSRFTYAEGRIVLWSSRESYVDPAGRILFEGDFTHIALANPHLAPYGRAARDVLETLELWPKLQPRIVQGESIAQTLQFVMSGNAELGFVAVSQLRKSGRSASGSQWVIPTEFYETITQQAVLLVESIPARAFLDFLRGAEARRIMKVYGYGIPGEEENNRAQ